MWFQPTDSIAVSLDNAIRSFEQSTVPSKRILLQSLAKIFDPLGILTPITIRAKMLLQSLWKHRLDWDEALTGSDLEEFVSISRGLANHVDIKIPRSLNVNNNNLKKRTTYLLRCFYKGVWMHLV